MANKFYNDTIPTPGAPNYADLDLGMTFGIEIECIAIYPTTLMAAPGAHGDAISSLSLLMQAKGIKSTGHETLEDDLPINGGDFEYSHWCVQDEGGLEVSKNESETLMKYLPDGVEYYCQPLEISSRILNFKDENWQQEIQAVLSIIQDLRAEGCSFITDSTTGLHVHIGLGKERIPLRTAKSVLQFCTGFEDRLDSVYSANRIDDKAAENVQPGRHFNAGLAWHFQHNPRTDFGPNVFHWLTEIQEAPSFEALGKFFCNEFPDGAMRYNKDKTDAHFSTLNLDNLFKSPLGDWDHFTPSTGTIEFRQHQGTLDAEEIISQVLLTRAIVTFCHSAPDTDFLQLFPNIGVRSYGLFELLRDIGCRQDLIEYYQERRSESKHLEVSGEYFDTIMALGEGQFAGSDALDAQAFIEHYERSNWPAVSGKIEAKHAAGAYGQRETRGMTVWYEFTKFFRERCVHFSKDEAANLARTMIFQQLNGDDIWTDPTPEEMLCHPEQMLY